MKPRSVVLAGLCLAALALAAGAADDKPPRAATYDSPKAVFEAAQAALKKDDFKTFYACLTPESGEMFAGQIAFGGAMMRGFAALDPSGKAKEKLKPVSEVLDKHGLTEAAMKKIKPVKPGDDPKELAKTLRKIVAEVKDKPAFVAEMLTVLGKLDDKKGGGGPKALVGAVLSDVKEDGDKAKATMTLKQGDTERKEPIEFAKVGGGWKIKLPDPTARKAAPPKPKDSD